MPSVVFQHTPPQFDHGGGISEFPNPPQRLNQRVGFFDRLLLRQIDDWL
jgi:hypothetical protein